MGKRKIRLIAILFITIAIMTIFLWTRNSSPTLISAMYDGGVNSFTIDLKVNGEYEINNNSWLTTNRFHGQYTLSDSIIIFDKKNIDNVILTDRLKICICPYYTDYSARIGLDEKNDLPPKCLIQIDESGNSIDTHFQFTVTGDNRN